MAVGGIGSVDRSRTARVSRDVVCFVYISASACLQAMEAMENQAERRRVIVSLALNATITFIDSILNNEAEDDASLWLVRLQILMLARRLRGERLRI